MHSGHISDCFLTRRPINALVPAPADSSLTHRPVPLQTNGLIRPIGFYQYEGKGNTLRPEGEEICA